MERGVMSFFFFFSLKKYLLIFRARARWFISLLLLKYGSNEVLSLKLITTRFKKNTNHGQKCQEKEMSSASWCFWRIFHFWNSCREFFIKYSSVFKLNALRSQTHERGPLESKSIDVSSLAFPSVLVFKSFQYCFDLQDLIWFRF